MGASAEAAGVPWSEAHPDPDTWMLSCFHEIPYSR